MSFGTFHLMEQPFEKSEAMVYREPFEQIRTGDAIGFDWVWLTEHHFSATAAHAETSIILAEGRASLRHLRHLSCESLTVRASD